MAALNLPNAFFRITKSFRNAAVAGVRNISSTESEHRVVGSSDGKVVVCWHPETEFPYEKSLPIQRVVQKSLTPLKVQNMKEVLSIFTTKKDEFVRQELMDITFTTKHRWFPEGKHKRRRRRNFEESRPYL